MIKPPKGGEIMSSKTALVPEIPLVIFDLILPQQRDKFVSERAVPVVLLLSRDVSP